MTQSRKKILIIAHHYPPHLTGVGMVAHGQAKRLAAAGHSVKVITSNTHKDEKSSVMDGVEVIRIKALNTLEDWGAPFPLFSPRLVWVLWKYAKRADIIHVHDAFYMSSFCATFFARIYKKPIVMTQHVAMIPHPSTFVVMVQKLVYATSGALIFQWSNLIITLNDRVAQFLIKKGVPTEKLVALPNGVDTDLFCPVGEEEKVAIKDRLGLSATKKIALFVGRFVPKKGFDKVFAARSNQYQIVFAGGEAPEYIGDEVVFLGKLSQAELVAVYQAADVFVLPSHGEGFPLSVQEAMASGLPVITTNDEGYRRYKFDERLVYLIDQPTDVSVRKAIETIMHDEARRHVMAAYSERYARTHFSWPLVVSKLERIYDDLLTI